MKKNYLLESVAIAAILTALAFSSIPLAFASYPGPDELSDSTIFYEGYNHYGESVGSGLWASYGGNGYDFAVFYSWRDLGNAQGYYGPLYYRWSTDYSIYREDYTDNSAIDDIGNFGPTGVAYVESDSWSWFYGGYPYIWGWEMILPMYAS